MTEREALKLALDAFGEIAWSNETQWQRDRAKEALTAIKEALAQPDQLFEENERLHVENRRLIDRIETIGVPVGIGGYVTTTSQPEQPKVRTGNCLRVGVCASEGHKIAPHRRWVGLTDEEILAVNMSTVTKLIDEPIVCDTDHNIVQLGKAIEAKLKDKNTWQDGNCKYCTDGCPACDARRQSNVLL